MKDADDEGRVYTPEEIEAIQAVEAEAIRRRQAEGARDDEARRRRGEWL